MRNFDYHHLKTYWKQIFEYLSLLIFFYFKLSPIVFEYMHGRATVVSSLSDPFVSRITKYLQRDYLLKSLSIKTFKWFRLSQTIDEGLHANLHFFIEFLKNGILDQMEKFYENYYSQRISKKSKLGNRKETH